MNSAFRGPEVAGHPAAMASIFNHVGLTTPDIFGTIDWYVAVFGFKLIMGPRVLEATSSAMVEAKTVFGPGFAKAYQAHMLSGNGVGVEVFQFVDPAVEPAEPGMGHARPGFFHICLTVDDVAATLSAVGAAGGTVVLPPTAFTPGRPWENAYCRDPWGATIELLSASYAECFANWPRPGQRPGTRLLARDGTESPPHS